MGTPPLAASASPAGAGSPQPKPLRNPYRDLDAWQGPTEHWWLCVDGDPERLYCGPFGSRDVAIRHRDYLVSGWAAAHPGVDG